MRSLSSLLLLSLLPPALRAQDCTEAESCDPYDCLEPECACSLSEPDDVPVDQRPQVRIRDSMGLLSLFFLKHLISHTILIY